MLLSITMCQNCDCCTCSLMWQLQKGTHCGLPAPIHPNAFDNFKGEKNRNNIFYVSVSGDLLQKVEWMMKENQNWWSVVADLLKNYS